MTHCARFLKPFFWERAYLGDGLPWFYGYMQQVICISVYMCKSSFKCWFLGKVHRSSSQSWSQRVPPTQSMVGVGTWDEWVLGWWRGGMFSSYGSYCRLKNDAHSWWLCRDGLTLIHSVPFGQEDWVGTVGMGEANATYYCRVTMDNGRPECYGDLGTTNMQWRGFCGWARGQIYFEGCFRISELLYCGEHVGFQDVITGIVHF